MTRMTRSRIAEVAEQVHIDADALLDTSSETFTANVQDAGAAARPALGEISGNADARSSLEKAVDKTQRQAKVALLNAQDNDAKKYDTEHSTPDTQQNTDAAVFENNSSPADSASIAQDIYYGGADGESQIETSNSYSPPSTATASPTLFSQCDTSAISESLELTSSVVVVESAEQLADNMEALSISHPPSPLPSAMPNKIYSLRKTDLRSTSNKENLVPPVSPLPGNRTPTSQSTYDALEAAAIEAATPPTALSRRGSAAFYSSSNDADGDDLNVSPSTRAAEKTPLVKAMQTSASISPTKPKTPMPRPTKTSQARILMAHGDKPPPTPSLGRPPASRQTSRTTSNGSNTSDSSTEATKKEVVIPHSKPRPMSMSFPAPPPRIRSSKAPTRSTFELPGEAVAAKFKAAREERDRKEAEELQKKSVFKARPAPDMTNKALVRPTNSSQLREGVHASRDGSNSNARLVRKRSSSTVGTTSRSISGSSNWSGRSASSLHSNATSRPSTAMAARPVSSKSQNGNDATFFERFGQSHDSIEEEKRAREAAMKDARTEAAERGRQASREWAEKQKLKKLQAQSAATSIA